MSLQRTTKEDTISHIKDQKQHEIISIFSVGGEDSRASYFLNLHSTSRKTPTGIAELSSAIGGGYTASGLAVFGGLPGCGKTTMCVQSAIEMSRSGYPSIFLSYDMSAFEIYDKVYSQISYELYGDKGYTLKDIADKKLLANTEKNRAIINAVADATQLFTVIDMLDEENVQKIVGTDYMTSNIEAIICLYCNIYDHPTIFIDNLQQLVGCLGYEGKAGIDKALNLLKAYAREYQIPIVLISTLNRASYDKPFSLTSGKESGNIEYIAHIIFGIEPKFITDGDEDITIDDFRESQRRDITIKCVKGRDTGFQKRYITLNAPYCRFEPYDETRPSTTTKRNRGKVKIVDN